MKRSRGIPFENRIIDKNTRMNKLDQSISGVTEYPDRSEVPHLTKAELTKKRRDLQFFEQKSRRYLGNKYKLISFLTEIIRTRCPNVNSVVDLFAGTGVVGSALNARDVRVVSNDFLQSNYVCLRTFLGIKTDITARTAELVNHLNAIPASKPNYFSHHFGDRYFTDANAKKIGAMREEIERITLDTNEHCILLCSLIYAADKVANTVGHYDAYRRRLDNVNSVE